MLPKEEYTAEQVPLLAQVYVSAGAEKQTAVIKLSNVEGRRNSDFKTLEQNLPFLLRNNFETFLLELSELDLPGYRLLGLISALMKSKAQVGIVCHTDSKAYKFLKKLKISTLIPQYSVLKEALI
ncbi:MAG: hypothetical protein GY786_13915 [Proteobacteria bacterium]|nr:hypothetical protein [Pseudomonadota bacterium]